VEVGEVSINELFEIKTEKEFNTEWDRCKRENVPIVASGVS
jgi:hypothetical protein